MKTSSLVTIHVRGIAVAAMLLAVSACAPAERIRESVSPSPSEPFRGPPPPRAEAVSSAAPFDVPAELREKRWGLPDVLDVALRNNPATRSAWQDARAAAARVGIARSAYYPDAELNLSAQFKSTRRNDSDETANQTFAGPNLGLSWLLLDFGSRAASEEGALQSLAAANWTQNRVLQDTVLQTQEAYYLYLAAKSLRDARQKSLESAETLLAAAAARHEAGVATIADVLQARTTVSQARLALDAATGTIAITRGSLAASMGLPANLSFDIEELPGDLPMDKVTAAVETLISQAMEKRPDLAALRAQAAASEAAVRKAEGDGRPVITVNAATGVTWFANDEVPAATPPADRREDVLSGGVVLTVPLFTGYASTYNIERARAEAESARERVRSQEQLAVFQVFSGYHALRTAAQKVRTSDDLLASATQSEEVALGRYKEGVGTVLDLVTAQAALADARTQSITSRWEWHTALAQLAHGSGILDLRGESPLTGK